jgi:hypothetical protein
MKMSACFATCNHIHHAHTDLQTRRTLRMLYNEHTRSAKELQRKIAALREEGIDPTLPQKPAPPRPSPASAPTAHGSSTSSPAYQKERLPDSQVDESFMVLGQQVRSTLVHLKTAPHSAPCFRSRRTLAMPSTRFGRPWNSSIMFLNL